MRRKKERKRDRRALKLAHGAEVRWSFMSAEIKACGVEAEGRVRRMPTSCVYMLFANEECVYVGQSTNLYERLWWHERVDGKYFDSWVRFDVPDHKRLEVEKALIYLIDPLYNERSADSEKGWSYDPEHVEYLREAHEKLPIR